MQPEFWNFVLALATSAGGVGAVASLFKWIFLPHIQRITAQATAANLAAGAAKQAAEAATQQSEAAKQEVEVRVAQTTQAAEIVARESAAIKLTSEAMTAQLTFWANQNKYTLEEIASLRTAVHGEAQLRRTAERKLDRLIDEHEELKAQLTEFRTYIEAVDQAIAESPDGDNIRKRLPPRPNGKHRKVAATKRDKLRDAGRDEGRDLIRDTARDSARDAEHDALEPEEAGRE